MHEFVCSEAQPTMPLSVADMVTPNGSVYLGEIFLTINPVDINPGSLGLHCKKSPSLLDTVAGTGHIIENVARAADLQSADVAGGNCDFKVVDTSTCQVTCRRCLSVLGDAQIAPDNADYKTAAGAGGDDSRSAAMTPRDGHFDLADMQDIKCLRDRVCWQSGRGGSSPGIFGSPVLVERLMTGCSVEQVYIALVLSWNS